MPFLRRRGIMASETDIRRRTLAEGVALENASSTASLPSVPQTPSSSGAGPHAINDDDEEDPDATPKRPTHSHPDLDAGRSPSLGPPRPLSPAVQEESSKHRRFSMLRFRNASDSQLNARVKQQADKPPPLPKPPEIITTAPTMVEFQQPQKKTSRLRLTSRIRRSSDLPADRDNGSSGSFRRNKKEGRKSISDIAFSSFQESSLEGPPPSIPESADESTPPRTKSDPLAPPGARFSESSASSVSYDTGNGSGPFNTRPGKASRSSSTFFRLPRRKSKQPEPLFALSHLPQASSSVVAPDLNGNSDGRRPSSGCEGSPAATRSPSVLFSTRSNVSPATALFRPGSVHSAQSSPTRTRLALRGRSSTMSSAGGRDSIDSHLSPPTGRSSVSAGRKSFGDLLGLSRFRQNSDQGVSTPLTPGSNTSKNNSLQIPRESVVIPEREADETPAKYLSRLELVVSRSLIASVLSKGVDQFQQAVLRSYMRRFSFFGDPMDMAIRKLLMEAELPKETQQIDRCLQAFANRYHECNPGIYASPDQAYFIAFSLLILHTDVFNKNNKYKMQKPDYLRNTRGEGVFDDILECFYDNITYTPFIHVQDDHDANGEHKAKKSIFRPPDSSKQPVDPYSLIMDKKTDSLRPNLKEILDLDDHYSYLGTAPSLNLGDLQKTFFKTGVLQIISARSRPDAFMTEKTASNPDAAHPGIVDIKITKVGLLWRKDTKKKKTRSPWQEWGAILTGAQLYFFRNTSWVKTLLHQYDSHTKAGNDGIPCIFKPPLENFKPDGLISTEGAVALVDSTYKKHKNAFLYVRPGGAEEVLLADDEQEMNDWLAKLNYAAAFRTSGVRMRGVVGGHYEGQSRRGFRRLESSEGTQSIQTPTGEVTIARGQIDHQMAQDILTARRDIMRVKITEANEQLEEAHAELAMKLRNARHLQILAPIQTKTRDQVMISAGRMAAEITSRRVHMWKLRCHRDILQLDLVEERLFSPVGVGYQDAPTSQEEEIQSPGTQVFQTPPTSLKAPSVHGTARSRSSSVSSAESSAVPFATPPSQEAREEQPTLKQPSYDVDAGERNLLQQAGLLAAEEDGTAPSEDGRHDKSKIRRSIHRTLREGAGIAGHLPLHRGRKGRDSVSSGATQDDISREEMLVRGSGSFVVHGKKASVINFGSELQTISPDVNRLRPHKAARRESLGPVAGSSEVDEQEAAGETDEPAMGEPPSMRRESAASASTATARSFRELHRKYSSAQAHNTRGGLMVPSDDDSDAAISFSEGRRTPLPPIDGESEVDPEEDEETRFRFFTPEEPSTPVDAESSASGAANGQPDATAAAQSITHRPIQTVA